MPLNTVFIYSGQGSHYYQMGRDLFERRGVFYRNAVELDDMFREHLGHSILESIYSDQRKPTDLFEKTTLTHPAIFLTEYALSKALISEGIEPDYVLSTSMGAFAALAVAGVLSIEHAVLAVITQAKLVDLHGVSGGMLALPHSNRQQAEVLARSLGCDVASMGDWTSNVLAADRERLRFVETALRHGEVQFQRLAVSRAFHSRWIDAAEEQYLLFLSSIPFQRPLVPVVCCADGKILHDLPRSYLWNVIRRPIRFEDAIVELSGLGDMKFIDAGPSGTLATSLKYCMPHLKGCHEVQAVLSPFGGSVARYEKLIASKRQIENRDQ